MPVPEKTRKIAGSNVYIVGGILDRIAAVRGVLGKVRLVTKRGTDVTETVNDSIRVTLQAGDKVAGKFTLVDSEGKPLQLLEALASDLNIIHSIKLVNEPVSCPVHPMVIPGIVTGAISAANDSMGGLAIVKVPKFGTILSATFWDLDYEKTQVDLEIFKDRITELGHDAAWDPSGTDMLNFVTELAFFTFDDHISSATSEITNIGKAYTCPKGYFWIQAVARGTPNIAYGSEPRFQLQILSDDPDFKA